jgi:3-dehydroquinate synthase II
MLCNNSARHNSSDLTMIVKEVWLQSETDLEENPPEIDNVIVKDKTRDGRRVVRHNILEELKHDQKLIPWITIESMDDVNIAGKAAELGAKDIILSGKNNAFPVGIALEKVIAETQRYGTNLHASVKSFEEMLAASRTLDVGVSLVVNDASLARMFKDYFAPMKFDLIATPVKSVDRVGACWRSCIDTGDIMSVGEGMLVGSTSSAYFLVHAEVIGTEYTGKREWRCNAGPVSNYIIIDKSAGTGIKTKYLSELKCGDSVLTVDRNGNARRTVVNRNKIEYRPAVKITTEIDGKRYSVLLQGEKSIHLTTKDGKCISVLDSLGQDVIMYHTKGGMHFGTKVEEGIFEY